MNTLEQNYRIMVFIEDRGEYEVVGAFSRDIIDKSARGIPSGSLHALPTNYVIDRTGVLRYAKAAAWNLDDLNDILVPLLREEAPET